MSEGIRVDRKGAVGMVVLDRPERRNAIDTETRGVIAEVLEELEGDDLVRVVLITGAGTAFCAGVDLTDPPSAGEPAWLAGRSRLVEPFERFGKPLLAAVNGPAYGGGFEIALCCELRVAARSARFALPEVRIGSMPGSGGTQRIFESVPAAVAWKALLTGDPIDAETALRVGLVSDVFDDDDLLEGSLELAHQVAQNAPLSLGAIKRAGRASGTAAGMELERALWALLSTTEDRAEGRAAFREKRPPEYKGR